ncbi:MAG: hypothetical protein IJ578_03435, partial [Bacteroidales bacterium]|nr:hypothetical protein [Bacteroidales bacterium]
MKLKSILKAAWVVVAGAFFTACASEEFKEVTELSLQRCLEPQNLSARVDASTGDNVTFGWNVNKDADAYNLVVYNDEAMSHEVLNVNVEPGNVPYTVHLTAD